MSGVLIGCGVFFFGVYIANVVALIHGKRDVYRGDVVVGLVLSSLLIGAGVVTLELFGGGN